MTRPPRRLGTALMTVPLLATLAACGGGSDAATETEDGTPIVRIDGVVPDPMGIPVLLIKEMGLDEKHGFVLEYSEGDPAGGTTPFLRGQVQLGPGDAVSAAIANLEGHDTVAYYPFMSHTASIVASADSGIQTPEDLVGKRVGHFGSDSGTTQAITLTLLDGWGIDVGTDLELVESAPEVLPELLAQGEVDAIFDYEPYGDRGIQLTDGVRVLSVADYWQESIDWTPPLAMLWSTREWLTDNPELAQSVQDAFAEAQDEIIATGYTVFREEPYAEFLDLADDGEMDRLIEYCVELPCYTNEWSESDAENMNAWIERMVEAGMLGEFPENAPSGTLDEITGGE